MSNAFMGGIIGAFGAAFYFIAPFMSDEKRAFQFRLISEVLLGIMFFYTGHLAGTAYYGVLALSGLFEKQIEGNRWFSLGYGIAGAVLTFILNNDGNAGIWLALSLVLVFFHLDENKMLTFDAYADALGDLVVLGYSLRTRVWVGFIFALLLLIIAISGLVSSIRISRSGGLKAVAAEQRAYEKKQKEKEAEKDKRNNRRNRKKKDKDTDK